MDEESELYSLSLVVPITIIYSVIFITGVLGNISTCIVIARNKSMHTVTNYFLFSLAVSDMLLLVSGLPPEMYKIWSPDTYIFGEFFCILQGLAAETAANATVLTIAAFTIERYVAICHPFLSHTMSNLSRAVRYIIAIWIIAPCLAAPQAMQFGIKYETNAKSTISTCTVVTESLFEHSFEISTFLFFVGPMTLITVLYVLIAIRIRKSRLISAKRSKRGLWNSDNKEEDYRFTRNGPAQNRVLKMLVAVVVAFFICWAPFHAQRLVAIYLATAPKEAQESSTTVYITLMHASGILYFLSTTINPVLYHIFSNKFRRAFKETMIYTCKDNITIKPMKRTNSGCKEIASANRNKQKLVLTDASVKKDTNQKMGSRSALDRKARAILNLITWRRFRHTRPESSPEIHLSNSCQRTETLGAIVYYAKTSSSANNLDSIDNAERKMVNRLVKSENNTSTISNSSLQDMDDSEFSSVDLVKYMKEVNGGLS